MHFLLKLCSYILISFWSPAILNLCLVKIVPASSKSFWHFSLLTQWGRTFHSFHLLSLWFLYWLSSGQHGFSTLPTHTGDFDDNEPQMQNWLYNCWIILIITLLCHPSPLNSLSDVRGNIPMSLFQWLQLVNSSLLTPMSFTSIILFLK